MALRFIAIDPGTDQGHCPADTHALHPSAGGCYAGDSRTSCAPSEAEPQERGTIGVGFLAAGREPFSAGTSAVSGWRAGSGELGTGP
jgi:hypothetical protein